MHISISNIQRATNIRNPFPDLNEWNKKLESCLPKDKETAHKWICVTRIGYESVQYQTMTEQEINEFYATNSKTGCTCTKLPLGSIFKVINNIIKKVLEPELPFGGFLSHSSEPDILDDQGFTLKARIEKQIEVLNSSLVKATGDEIKKCLTMTDLLEKVHANLEKMCQRSQDKRDKEIQSIWGKVKWFFLSWFYDNKSKLELIPSSKEKLLAIINPALRARILSEIKAFEKEIKLPQGDCIKADEIQTFQDIRQGWLRNYGPGKYKGQDEPSERAKDLLNNIIALNKFWGEINTQDLSAKGEQARQEKDFIEEMCSKQSTRVSPPPEKERARSKKRVPSKKDGVEPKKSASPKKEGVRRILQAPNSIGLTQEQIDTIGLINQARRKKPSSDSQ